MAGTEDDLDGDVTNGLTGAGESRDDPDIEFYGGR